MGQKKSKTSQGNDENETEDPCLNLPSPPRPAKTILLNSKLKPNHGNSGDVQANLGKEISLRSCLHTFAREAELEELQDQGMRRRKNEEGEGDRGSNPREVVGTKTPVLGSEDRLVTTYGHGTIIGNYGFLSTVWKAYDHHYTLRTSPEDWWYTIIRKIAVAIDKNAKSEVVRNFFVSHEEKKTLTVQVGPSIYSVDYAWFLDQMTSQISDNLKVQEYVDIMKADFTTSTATHMIVSEITVMASMQEYFDFTMCFMCGIPFIEMEGEEKDWAQIKTKLVQLKSLLEPISEVLGLSAQWWDGVELICDKLLKTFQGEPDTKWWSHIFDVKYPNGSGSPSYHGWFIADLLGIKGLENLGDLNNGVITVPMSVVDGMTGVREEAAFAGGIAGFEMFKEPGSKWPSVQAAHGWVLMLEPDSRFREDLVKWELKLGRGA